MPLVLIIAVAALALLFWGFQFVQLMMLEDSDFPGRYDKILWFILFCTTFLLAPFLFIAWKKAIMRFRQGGG